MGKLDIDRGLELVLQGFQDGIHPRDEIAVAEQTLESHHRVVTSEVASQRPRQAQPVLLQDRHQLVHQRIIISALFQQIPDFQGLETVGLQVDHVDLLRRIADLLIQGHVDPQVRLAGRDQHRVVVAEAVDRPGAEAGHQADQPVLPLDAPRPAEFIVAEGHAGEGGQKIAPDPGADALLDHDPHLLVEVDHPALQAVFDRIGAKGGGIDLHDRIHQRRQAFLFAALVGNKQAFILAGKGSAHAIFQQAGAAHDQGSVFKIV